MGKKVGIAAGILVVLGFAGAMVNSLFFGPSDEQLIKETLVESTKAAAEGRTSPVLDGISRNFQYGDESADRMEISKYVKNAKPAITILNMTPQIEGNTATVKTDVLVGASFLNMEVNQTVPDVTITLRRESTFHGLLPATKWRVTKVEAKALPAY